MASTWAVLCQVHAKFGLKLYRRAPNYQICRLCFTRNVFNTNYSIGRFHKLHPLLGIGHSCSDLSPKHRLPDGCHLHSSVPRCGSDVKIKTEQVISGEEKRKLIKQKKEAKREARLERLRQKEAKSNVLNNCIHITIAACMSGRTEADNYVTSIKFFLVFKY